VYPSGQCPSILFLVFPLVLCLCYTGTNQGRGIDSRNYLVWSINLLPSTWLAYVNKPKAPVTSDQQCEQKSWRSWWELGRAVGSGVGSVDPWDFLSATSAWITYFAEQSASWESDLIYKILPCDSVLCHINQDNFLTIYIFKIYFHPPLPPTSGLQIYP